MNPQIVHRPQMSMIGLSVLSNSSMDITPLWQRFEEMEHRIHYALSAARYVITTWGAETELTRQHFVFVGVEISRIEAPPVSAVIKILPPAQYAIFPTRAGELGVVWKRVMEDWLPKSPYERPRCVIERYDRNRYLEAPPEWREVDIFVPLRLKSAFEQMRKERKRAQKE